MSRKCGVLCVMVYVSVCCAVLCLHGYEFEESFCRSVSQVVYVHVCVWVVLVLGVSEVTSRHLRQRKPFHSSCLFGLVAC